MSERSLRRDHERRLEAAERRKGLIARRTGLAAATVGAFALAPASASAANFDVQTNGDGAVAPCTMAGDCTTLRDAVDAANNAAGGDTITFQASLTGTTITLTNGPIPILDSGDLYIYGPGAEDLAVSGDDISQVFNVGDVGGGYISIQGLTMTEGFGDYAGAVSTEDGTDVELFEAAVTDSLATGANDGTGDPGDFFGSGGGILNRGDMYITDSVISGNEEQAATEGYFYGGAGIDNAGFLTIDGSTITDNHADHIGGAIMQSGLFGKYRTQTEISDSVISGNTAQDGGGALAVFAGSKYLSSRNKIENTKISGNLSNGPGAALSIKYIGGGASWNVTHSTIDNNIGSSYGGGVALGFVPGSFTLSDSTVSGNTATEGGGVYLSQAASKYEDSVDLANSTIAGNSATSDGGGVFVGPGGPYDNAPFPIHSTIVADNTAAGSPEDLAVDGASTSSFDLAFSLVEAPAGAPFTQSGANILGVDPQLGPLAGNGGPTQTQVPAVTSPVVDQGHGPSGLTTDQRGGPRTIDVGVPKPPGGDGTDIGSVELSTGPPKNPTTPTNPTTTISPSTKLKRIKTRKKRKRVSVSFTSNVPGSTFQCKVDGGPFTPCTSPFSTKLRSKRGKGKLHRITIQATGPTGVVEPQPTVFEFRIVRI